MVITWWMIPIGGLVGFLTYTSYHIAVGIKQGIFFEEIAKFKQEWAKFKEESKQEWAKFKEDKEDKEESIAVYKAVPSLLFLLIMSITILGIIGMFITAPFVGYDNLVHSLLWKVFVFMAFTPVALLILFLVAVFLMAELMFLIILAFEFLVLKCLGLSKDDIPTGDRWLDF